MLNRSLIVILWHIWWLLTQIINHNRSKFVLSKLVLTSVCCKHFMYRCMHRSCTLSCVHVECMCTYFVIRLLFIVQNSDRIFLKYQCQSFFVPKIWLIKNTIIFNLIKCVSIINHNYIITLLLKLVGRYKNNYLVTHSDVSS